MNEVCGITKSMHIIIIVRPQYTPSSPVSFVWFTLLWDIQSLSLQLVVNTNFYIPQVRMGEGWLITIILHSFFDVNTVITLPHTIYNSPKQATFILTQLADITQIIQKELFDYQHTVIIPYIQLSYRMAWHHISLGMGEYLRINWFGSLNMYRST